MKLLKIEKLFVTLILLSTSTMVIYNNSFLFQPKVRCDVRESNRKLRNITENHTKGRDSSVMPIMPFLTFLDLKQEHNSDIEQTQESAQQQSQERKVKINSSSTLHYYVSTKVVVEAGVYQRPEPHIHQTAESNAQDLHQPKQSQDSSRGRSDSHTQQGSETNPTKDPESTLLQGREPHSQQNTVANLRQHKNSSLERSRTLSLEDTSPEVCLPIPINLQVRPVSQQECGAPHVVIHSGGRLGNKLCQYVSLFLLRHLFGVRVSITNEMNTTMSLILENVTLPVQDPSCFTKDTKRIFYHDLYRMLYQVAQDARARSTQEVVTDPLLKRSYYVFNHPCPRDLIMAHRGLVRRLLTFKEELLQRARDSINQALRRLNKKYKREQVTLITVHVRRGDYTNYIRTHYNLTQLDEVYFNRAFDYYRRKVVNPVFVVVSDDHKWCRKFLRSRDIIVAAGKTLRWIWQC
ncbi:uncharacterized protein [Panulirus ornatus]|uniref:uncharacterized protein isoform X2 n=1 Tax=Panulirus ornatus TaxID=150431 RepID=UPI003A8B9A8F